MIYGLRTGAFVEHGPTAKAMEAQDTRSTARAWRALDQDRRIALVERALHPANDQLAPHKLAL